MAGARTIRVGRRVTVAFVAVCSAALLAGPPAMGSSPAGASPPGASPGHATPVENAPATAPSGSGGWGRLVSVDPDKGGATASSCVSPDFCAVVDGFGAALVGAGTHWKRPDPIDPGQPLVAVSCATVSFCVTADAAGRFFEYDGSQWSTQQHVPAARGVDSIACASPTFCLAVTNHTRSLFEFDGAQWTEQPSIPGTSNNLTSISCAASDWCGVGDSDGQVAILDSDGWGSWYGADGEPNMSAHVQCPVTQFCLAVVGSVSLVNSAGTWSTIPDGVPRPKDLSCGSATMCAMVGLKKSIQVFDGSSWHTVVAHESYDRASTLACAAPSWCVEVDYLGEGQEWDGTSWTRRIPIDPLRGTDYGGSLVCPAVSFCALTDPWGNIALRVGSRWTKPILLGAPRSYWGMQSSCASPTFCVAIGLHETYVWDGSTWTRYAENPVRHKPTAIACDEESFCMAFSKTAAATTTDGVDWTQIPLPSGVGQQTLWFSCVSPTFCMALDNLTMSVIWNGTTWLPPQQMNGGQYAEPATCGSTSWCVAAAGNGQVVTWSGGSWSSPVQVFSGAT